MATAVGPRALLTAIAAWRHQFRVAGMRQESPHTVSVYIKGRHLKELAAEPGQFFRWRFLTRGLWWQSHPYSLSAVPSDELMRITVQGTGDASAALARLAPGTRVLSEGPFGASVAWSLAVWWLGEGFDGVLESAAVTVGSRTAMSVTMAFMLLIMI